MKNITCLFGLAGIVLLGGTPMNAAERERSEVVSCAQTGNPGPGIGHAFRGDVSNEDYRFSVVVPSGFTGWTGVGDSAPFHGFTIFLDASRSSCIVFETHLRVDENEAPEKPKDAQPIVLGSAKGWRVTTSGNLNGVQLINVKTTFSNARTDQVDDGYVLLVTPSTRLAETLRSYNTFLRRLKFRH